MGDEYTVEFTQKMTLQGGEYLLSMSCTGFEHGEHVVYHRLYNDDQYHRDIQQESQWAYMIWSPRSGQKRKAVTVNMLK